MKGYTKPPLGVMPKYLWDISIRQQRFNELMGGISRYHSVGKEVPKEWFKEASKLEKWLKRKERISDMKLRYLKGIQVKLRKWVNQTR